MTQKKNDGVREFWVYYKDGKYSRHCFDSAEKAERAVTKMWPESYGLYRLIKEDKYWAMKIKLDKAVEALRFYAEIDAMLPGVGNVGSLAGDTLKEIEGGRDD